MGVSKVWRGPPENVAYGRGFHSILSSNAMVRGDLSKGDVEIVFVIVGEG
jgi:hypothetical protein